MRTRFGPPHQIIGRIAVLGTVVLLAGSCAYITKASVASDGTTGNLDSRLSPGIRSVISDDGRYVVFESDARNLVADDTNLVSDVFRHDNVTRDTVAAVGDHTIKVRNPGALGNTPGPCTDCFAVI